MYIYQLYGNTVCSDLAFPQLIQAGNSKREQTNNIIQAEESKREHTDIIIQAGKIPEDIKLQEKIVKYNFGQSKSWLINSTAWLLVEEGCRVTYELRPQGNINYLRTYILGYAMSMLYLQRGEMAIHCAAVSKGGEAILIAGESGSGKSTVTDVLLDAGFQLMADDMAVVKINEFGKAMVAPGFPYQKLCRDVIQQRGFDFNQLIYINEEKDKFLVPYKEEFSLEEKPLRAMFILYGDALLDKLWFEELKGFDKFHACADNLFLKRLLKKQRHEAYVGKICLDIASKFPIYLIRRPLGVNTLSEIIDYIVSIT